MAQHNSGRVYHWKHGWVPISPEAKAAVALREQVTAARQSRAELPVPAYGSLSTGLQKKISDRLEQMTGVPDPILAMRVQANLQRLYQQGDKGDLKWYPSEGQDIANRANDISNQYGVNLSAEQLTGMVAVTSAHKRWAENKDFAESIARKLAEDKPFPVSQEMIDDYNSWASHRKGDANPVTLSPGTYKPSDLPVAFAASKTPGMPRAINADYVIAAASIYRGELSLDEAIHGPKQRSFVNNLLEPDDPRFATIDTWQYKASMQGIPLKREIGPKGNRRTYNYTLEQWADRDLARSDGRAEMFGYDPSKPVSDKANQKAIFSAADNLTPQVFFQSGPGSVADKWPSSYGTYPWFVEQTQAVAARLGVSPSGLQAVSWTAVGGGI